MSDLANRIRQEENCGEDFDRENPIVLQAYNGLLAYAPAYQASCLRSSSGSYCFADAITNITSPTDSYIYYVVVGSVLPGGSRPTCNKCLQSTLEVFADGASNVSQPVSQRFVQTAQVINLGCGPTFVNTTIPAAKGSASRIGRGPSSASWLLVAATVAIGITVL